MLRLPTLCPPSNMMNTKWDSWTSLEHSEWTKLTLFSSELWSWIAFLSRILPWATDIKKYSVHESRNKSHNSCYIYIYRLILILLCIGLYIMHIVYLHVKTCLFSFCHVSPLVELVVFWRSYPFHQPQRRIPLRSGPWPSPTSWQKPQRQRTWIKPSSPNGAVGGKPPEMLHKSFFGSKMYPKVGDGWMGKVGMMLRVEASDYLLWWAKHFWKKVSQWQCD